MNTAYQSIYLFHGSTIHFTTENATRPQVQAGLRSDEVVEGEVGADGKEGDEEEACVGENYIKSYVI